MGWVLNDDIEVTRVDSSAVSVAYPELGSGGFPKVANVSGW